MKKITISFLLFLPFLLSSQIIPNGNFEEWEVIDDIEIPVNWTLEKTHLDSILKKPSSFDGEYAVELISLAGDGSPSYINFENRFPIHLAPTKISAQIKYSEMWAEIKWWMAIQMHERNGNWQLIADTVFTEDINDFIPIELSLSVKDRFGFDSLSIRFYCSNSGNGLGFGLAHLTIDQVHASNFDNPTNPENLFISRLFPNPATEKLFIENYCVDSDGSARYRIFDFYGRLLDDFHLACDSGIVEIPLDNYTPGTYFLQHCLTDCILNVKKFVITH